MDICSGDSIVLSDGVDNSGTLLDCGVADLIGSGGSDNFSGHTLGGESSLVNRAWLGDDDDRSAGVNNSYWRTTLSRDFGNWAVGSCGVIDYSLSAENYQLVSGYFNNLGIDLRSGAWWSSDGLDNGGRNDSLNRGSQSVGLGVDGARFSAVKTIC